MTMCEELGLATSVHNQYDDIKDSHKCFEFERLLGVCGSRRKLTSRENEMPVNNH